MKKEWLYLSFKVLRVTSNRILKIIKENWKSVISPVYFTYEFIQFTNMFWERKKKKTKDGNGGQTYCPYVKMIDWS